MKEEKVLETYFGPASRYTANKENVQDILELLKPIFYPYGGKSVYPVSKSIVEQIPSTPLRIFCHYNAIYNIVTEELVLYLKKLIGEDSAIEVGSGVGTLGRALNIPCTDNFMQRDFPDVVASYNAMKQPLIDYGEHVEKMDGLEAVKHYKPKVVVGSWITHQYDPNNHSIGGNAYGFNEYDLFKNGVERYIMVGNESIHGKKPIYSHPDYTTVRIKEDFIKSRSQKPELNTIYITTKNG